MISIGATVRITRFSVADNSSKYRLMSHRFKISIYFMTQMELIDNFDCPLNKFEFKSFKDFKNKKVKENDTIGKFF